MTAKYAMYIVKRLEPYPTAPRLQCVGLFPEWELSGFILCRHSITRERELPGERQVNP